MVSLTPKETSLIAAAPKTLIGCQIAYTILADIRHNWAGRHTPEGQAALIALRDAISDATGANPQDVQDEYSSANIQKAMSQS